jgi:hypothetical protein
MSETETEAVNMKSAKQNLFILDFSNSDSTSSEVIKAERDGRKADSLEVHIEAKRPGPKSSAQTPAKPSERRSGSSKNKAGSAGENSGDAISFSKKVIEALQNKVKEHNSKSSRKVTLSQLKKVYRRGAGAFSSSHRPGKTRGQWAMARVNMFLRMMSGGKVKDAYRKADQDIAKGSSNAIDISDSWEPTEEDLADALIEAQAIGDFDFESADELYLDDEKETERWYEI